MATNYKVTIEHYEATENELESWGFKQAFAKKGFPSAEVALKAAQPFYRAAAQIDGGDSWDQIRFDFDKAEPLQVSYRVTDKPEGANA